MILLRGKNLIKILILFSIILVGSHYSVGQNSAQIVEQAQIKAYSKDFAGADRILTFYLKTNNDLQVLRFHAQVLYWMQDFKRAKQVYEKLQQLYPENNEVKLDYGRFLYETGKTGAAETVIKNYLQQDPGHVEANIMLIYINIWNGNMDNAKQRALYIGKVHPENENIQNILEEINSSTAPVINISADTYSDDQPLKYAGFQLAGSWYKSWLFSPTFQLKKRSFSSFEFNSPATIWWEAGNTFYFKSKTTLKFKGGVFISSSRQDPFYTKGLSIKQQIIQPISFQIDYEETPYQYTNSSILRPFLYTTYKGSLKYDKAQGMLGEVGHQQQIFPDHNTIKATYIWLLVPIVKKPQFRFDAGYSFNFSTSDNSTFTVTETPSGGGIGFSPVNKKPAMEASNFYDLYFTPKNQLVNSLLSSIRIGSEKTNFKFKLNLGFMASADAPYNENTSSITFEKLFYTPVELESSLNFGINRNLTLSGQYKYQSLFFFKNHGASFQLTYRIKK